jgi:hypothetical protein
MYSALQDWIYCNEERLKTGFLLMLLALNSAALYFALAFLGMLPLFLNCLQDIREQYFYYLLMVTSLGNLLYIIVFFISQYYRIKQ